MKCKMTELGIELIPETDYDKKCLKHLSDQYSVTIKWEDSWDQKGNLILEGKSKDWNDR